MTGQPAGPPIALSTASVYPEPTHAAFELAAELGYDGVELMVWSDPVSQDVAAVSGLAERHGVPVLAVHAPCLAVTQRVWGSDPVGRIRRSVAAAVEWGADTVVVHPPFRWQRRYAGVFADEVAPIKVTRRDGSVVEFAADEHPRRDTTMARLAGLKPLHPEIDGFSITAGNASGSNDGAAALAVVADDLARAEGLAALANVRAWAAVGVQPRMTGVGAVDAAEKVLDRAGLRASDVHLWEINEAFASVPVLACRALGLDEERVNVHGSGCSIGHSVAASGARMLTTLTHELRRRGGGIGVATMCAGGGQGGAVVVEVP